VLQRITQLQFGAREEICCLDKPPYLDAPGTAATDLELLARGVACRTIYERASVEHPGGLDEVEQLLGAGQQARVLPSIPMKLYLIDRRHAVLPLQREPASAESAVVVHAPALLAALSTLFEGLWQRALPMQMPTDPVAAGRRAAIDEHRLITLLLSGLTDEAIARQLTLGYRTVQRHIAALMTKLGAHTRFQAGVQAALNHHETQR
jgi:DNA-binding CsgD family transcriptional regulator